MIIDRRVLKNVGFLSEHFFPAYFEDGDLCHRAMRAGFSVVYAPRPMLYHKVGSTVRAQGLSLQLAYDKSRLRVIYVRRNYRGLNKAIAPEAEAGRCGIGARRAAVLRHESENTQTHRTRS